MHEFHLAKSVLASIIKKTASLENLKKITSVSLKIGDLKMVTPESFSKTFKEIAKTTICRDTHLDIEIVKGDIFLVENIEAEFKE